MLPSPAPTPCMSQVWTLRNASPGAVPVQAVTLTSLGGLIGVILGFLISVVINWLLPALPSSVPIWAVFFGVATSMAVGLFFGIYPAVLAARLDPVEALRYE